MRRTHGWRTFAAALILVSTGCQSRQGPAAPDPVVSLAGTWSGTATDSEAGEGTVQWVMTHSDSGVAGTFTNDFADAAFSASGTLAGIVTGTAGTVFLMPVEPLKCSPTFAVTGTIYVTLAIGGDRITGRYSTFTCVGGRAGTLDLSRR